MYAVFERATPTKNCKHVRFTEPRMPCSVLHGIKFLFYSPDVANEVTIREYLGPRYNYDETKAKQEATMALAQDEEFKEFIRVNFQSSPGYVINYLCRYSTTCVVLNNPVPV